MNELREFWQLEFVRWAVLVTLAGAPLWGMVGTLIVWKRWVTLGGGIAHAVFGGLGFAYWAGIDPRLGALGFGLVGAGILAPLAGKRSDLADAAVGVLWAAGMAIGLLFVHLSPGYVPDLFGFLFGDLLTVGPEELAWTLVLDIAWLLSWFLFRRELVAVVFDEDWARLRGLPVQRYSNLLLILVTLSMLLLLHLVGVVLALALLTLPALAARRLARGLAGLMAVASLLSLLFCWAGLATSLLFDLPVGPVAVLVGLLVTGMFSLKSPPRSRPFRATGGSPAP
jgi:zinc transport system permease protein